MTSVSFDQAVQYYDITRGYPPHVCAKIRDAILQYTQTSTRSRFLELGIGTGLIGLPFIEAQYNYTGVDISLLMMAQIGEKLNSKTARPQLVQADILQVIPFSNQVFDVVAAIRVFHLLENWQAAIAEARRVLRQGGYLLIARDASVETTDKANLVTIAHAQWDAILESVGVQQGSIRPGLWLSDETIQNHLRESGATTDIVDLLVYDSEPISIWMMANRHKQRMYSRDWELSDDVHQEAVKHLDEWLDNECPEPDKAVSQKIAFRAIIARWEN
jgi:ubiquinone/menaquinone biosynthesis C-methylase UbiE